jgi:hypothetical protein
MKQLRVELFETNAPNPPRLTQTSWVVHFRGFYFGRQNSCETRPRESFATSGMKQLPVEFF